jgi:hypothetical protein
MYQQPVANSQFPKIPSSVSVGFPSMPSHRSQYDFVPSNTVQMHDFDAGRLLDFLLLFFGLFLL